MADAKSKWNTDAHRESETEIADLAPYVSRSAVDAVRDAFRAIVLENQDHSELLDELLPRLKQEPSMRSQSLDWLDVELSSLSDDTIIDWIDEMKRKGSQALQLDRELAAAKPEGARPPVEPAIAPRGRRRRWMMPAAIAACLPLMLLLGIGWVQESSRSSVFQTELSDLRQEIRDIHEKSVMVNRILQTVGRWGDPEETMLRIGEVVGVLTDRVDDLFERSWMNE